MPKYIAIEFQNSFIGSLLDTPEECLEEFSDMYGDVREYQPKVFEVSAEVKYTASTVFSIEVKHKL